jgi:hypothetical protein
MSNDAQVNAALAQKWRKKADQLDRFAEQCRREGIIQGPEGAEDAQAAADDYRRAAAELEFDGAVGEGRR